MQTRVCKLCFGCNKLTCLVCDKCWKVKCKARWGFNRGCPPTANLALDMLCSGRFTRLKRIGGLCKQEAQAFWMALRLPHKLILDLKRGCWVSTNVGCNQMRCRLSVAHHPPPQTFSAASLAAWNAPYPPHSVLLEPQAPVPAHAKISDTDRVCQRAPRSCEVRSVFLRTVLICSVYRAANSPLCGCAIRCHSIEKFNGSEPQTRVPVTLACKAVPQRPVASHNSCVFSPVSLLISSP